MNKDNEVKKDYSIYIVMAIIFAFIMAFFLNIAGHIIVALSKVLIKYWYVGLILVLLILFFRRKKKK